MPLPMPRLAPVTMATLPSSRIACQVSFSCSFACKDDANGTTGAHHLTGCCHRATCCLDSERRNAVAGLIGRVQEASRRIQGEVARLAALGGLPANCLQQARVGIDGVDHDAVMA